MSERSFEYFMDAINPIKLRNGLYNERLDMIAVNCFLLAAMVAIVLLAVVAVGGL